MQVGHWRYWQELNGTAGILCRSDIDDIDKNSMVLLDHQSKELGNYRDAVHKMGSDIITLRRQVHTESGLLRRTETSDRFWQCPMVFPRFPDQIVRLSDKSLVKQTIAFDSLSVVWDTDFFYILSYFLLKLKLFHIPIYTCILII